MLTIEEIREKLKDRNLMKVHKATGVGYSNLHGIANGQRSNPTYKVLSALSNYLENN